MTIYPTTLNIQSQAEGYAIILSLRPLPDGRRSAAARTGVSDCAGFAAKLTPTPFGTHRAFTHALPPSFGLRSVPFTVPPCFFPLPLK